MKPYKNFRLEIKRLLNLYNAGIYAFISESKRIKRKIFRKDAGFDPESPIYLENKEDELHDFLKWHYLTETGGMDTPK